MYRIKKDLRKSFCRQIQNHLNRHQILPVNQSGFWTGYSCTRDLLNITDIIDRTVDAEKIKKQLILDFSRAFDAIN